MSALQAREREKLIRRFGLLAGRTLSRVRIRGIPRLMYWSSPLIAEPGIRILESVTGVRIAIDVRDYASCMMLWGRFSPELITLIRNLVRPGESVIDVGAQLGYITSHLAVAVGVSGIVYSFEPDPNALRQLRATVEANGHTWVKIFPVALGSQKTEIEFNVSPVLGWSTAVSGSHFTDLSAIRVPATTLDSLSEGGEIRRPVRFVKIDVEGFECAVLDGMKSLIDRDRPLILIEVNPTMLRPAGKKAEDVLNRIASHEYKLYRVTERTGIIKGGEVKLSLVKPEAKLEFCDVLGVPEGRVLPENFPVSGPDAGAKADDARLP